MNHCEEFRIILNTVSTEGRMLNSVSTDRKSNIGFTELQFCMCAHVV